MAKRKHISDRNRFSILQPDYEKCFRCGSTSPGWEIHEMIHGTANRQKAKDDGLTCRLCQSCHRIVHGNRFADLELKKKAQQAYEELYGHEAFMNRYHHNYL